MSLISPFQIDLYMHQFFETSSRQDHISHIQRTNLTYATQLFILLPKYSTIYISCNKATSKLEKMRWAGDMLESGYNIKTLQLACRNLVQRCI